MTCLGFALVSMSSFKYLKSFCVFTRIFIFACGSFVCVAFRSHASLSACLLSCLYILDCVAFRSHPYLCLLELCLCHISLACLCLFMSVSHLTGMFVSVFGCITFHYHYIVFVRFFFIFIMSLHSRHPLDFVECPVPVVAATSLPAF